MSFIGAKGNGVGGDKRCKTPVILSLRTKQHQTFFYMPDALPVVQQDVVGAGTHFLLKLETTVFVFHHLGATSKPFSYLSSRLAHAACLGFFLRKRAT